MTSVCILASISLSQTSLSLSEKAFGFTLSTYAINSLTVISACPPNERCPAPACGSGTLSPVYQPPTPVGISWVPPLMPPQQAKRQSLKPADHRA